MSLEETINKLIKAVENSSRADMNIPWTGTIPSDCKCVLWLDGMDDTKTPGNAVDCVRLLCGKKFYSRVFTPSAPNGVGYWRVTNP